MLAPSVTADRSMSPSILPDDDEIIELLRLDDFDTHLQILNRLSGLARRDPNWFKNFAKKAELLKQFERLLNNERWEMQHQCMKFLLDAFPTFSEYSEWCISFLLPTIVTKLGSAKITVRRVTNQMLATYLKCHPFALDTIQTVVASYLQNNQIPQLARCEALSELSGLFVAECRQMSWRSLTDALLQVLQRESEDSLMAERCINAISNIRDFVGINVFKEMVVKHLDNQHSWATKHLQALLDSESVTTLPVANPITSATISATEPELRYRYGVVPIVISTMLNDDSEPQARLIALEQVQTIGNVIQLEKILESLSADDVRKLSAHLHSYFIALGNILDSLNFKIVLQCLGVLRLTLQRLDGHLVPHIQQVISLISKHFGNQKMIIKERIMSICMIIMRNTKPKIVISNLCAFLEHKNSRIREEILNIVTATFLTLDVSELNLKAILAATSPLLADPKRRVRLAAFELFAVFAAKCNIELEALMNSVVEVEQKLRAYGLVNALKVRITRNNLPTIRDNGLIEYAVPISNETTINHCSDWSKNGNLDYDWIMNGSNAPSSAISRWGFPMTTALRKQQGSSIENQIRQKSQEKDAENRFEVAILRPFSNEYDRYSNAHGNGESLKTLQKDELIQSLDRLRSHKQQNIEEVVGSGDSPKIDQILTKSSSSSKSKAGISASLADDSASFSGLTLKPLSIYYDGYAPSEPAIPTHSTLPSMKKSSSHQNLASTSKHNLSSSPSPLRQLSRKFCKSNLSLRRKGVGAGAGHRSVSNNSTKALKNNGLKSDLVVQKPELALSDALRKLDAGEWNEKVTAIETISQLSKIRPDLLTSNVHTVVLKLLDECKNLRTTVSRAAISAVGTLFEYLGTAMDTEIEKICSVLMQKAGDVSSAFIREDAAGSLEQLIKHASPGRALSALVTSGLKNKSSTIRACCATLITHLIERIGPSNVLNSAECPKYINALLVLAKDANASVRYSGKYGLKVLSQDRVLFEKKLHKASSEIEVKSALEILESIKKRGLESSNLDASSVPMISLSRSSSIRRTLSGGKQTVAVSQNVQNELERIQKDLIANEWERRLNAVRQFDDLVKSGDTKALLASKSLLEAFIGRLNDINSKVSHEAMQVLNNSMSTIASEITRETSLKTLLNQLVIALMSHLASKSDVQMKLAKKCLQGITDEIDNSFLSLSFAAATKQANVKQKPFMLNLMNRINLNVYTNRPKQVEVTALPVLWHLLRTPSQSRSDSEVRDAVRTYARGLKQCLGEKALIDLANANVTLSQREALQALLNH